MTKAELRRRMSHAEYREWQVYYSMEPWGTEAHDLRAARICQTMANIHRPRRTAPIPLKNFIPEYRKPQKRQDWREQARIAKLWSM